MKIVQQSLSLRNAFNSQIQSNKDLKKEEVLESSGIIGAAIFEFNQFHNRVKGGVGETDALVWLSRLPGPGEWVGLKNALIPTDRNGTLTEIDLIVIGSGGIFLVEVKAWKGSFNAYRDNWQYRHGNKWVDTGSSPSRQNFYHQQMFGRWFSEQFPKFEEALIAAPVVFTGARWLRAVDCSVPVFHGAWALVEAIKSYPEKLNSSQINQISEAIANI